MKKTHSPTVYVYGDKIREERKRSGLTQEQLGEIVEKTKNTIINIENKGRTLEETVKKLAEVFNDSRSEQRAILQEQQKKLGNIHWTDLVKWYKVKKD